MKLCEKCGIEIEYSKLSRWATGRFCSKKCANSRIHTNKTKEKISLGVKLSTKFNKWSIIRNSETNSRRTHICEKCSCQFTGKIRDGRKIHCNDCKRKPGRQPNPNNLYSISARTRTKVIARLNLKCSRCGWNEASIDLHHIISRKNNGDNSFGNISPLCPNC